MGLWLLGAAVVLVNNRQGSFVSPLLPWGDHVQAKHLLSSTMGKLPQVPSLHHSILSKVFLPGHEASTGVSAPGGKNGASPPAHLQDEALQAALSSCPRTQVSKLSLIPHLCNVQFLAVALLPWLSQTACSCHGLRQTSPYHNL